MSSCAICDWPGTNFYEQHFFCTPHWRAAYNLAFDAQKKVTQEVLEKYIRESREQKQDIHR